MDTLSKYKEQTGKSVRTLAVELGLSLGYTQALIKGTKSPSLAAAKQISERTDGSVSVSSWPNLVAVANAVNGSLAENENQESQPSDTKATAQPVDKVEKVEAAR